MEKSNKFYTTSSTKYPGSIKSTKLGNHLIFNIIKVLSENGGFTNCLSESQYNTIMNKGEKRLEAETNLNHSHDKLRFLFAALEDKENRKLFMKSPIISHVIKPFIAGYTEKGKEKDQWSNFKPVSDCEKVLEKKASNGVLFAALTCDRANKRSPSQHTEEQQALQRNHILQHHTSNRSYKPWK